MSPKVSALILNWKNPQDTVECVASVLGIDYDNLEILLIDNHSEDDSVRIFQERFPSVRVLENRDNLGYAGGNNVAIRQALDRGAEFVFILNNDIVVQRDSLKKLLQASQENPGAGVLAPKVLFYEDHETINSLGTSLDWFKMRPRLGDCQKKDDFFGEAFARDILVGCAIIIPRRTFERIGLFDEKFFLIHEDADLCLRNSKSGFKNIVVPQAVVYHKGSRTLATLPALTHYYSTRNFLYLAFKNAKWSDLLRMVVGCVFLTLKHVAWFFSNSTSKKKLAEAFFGGVVDALTGVMGKCQRVL